MKTSTKRFIGVALAMFGMFAGVANAQRPRQIAHNAITVSKDPTHDAQFNNIQAAVNAARAGAVIEILDESVYEEMVIIDGRANSPWLTVPKPAGGGVELDMRNGPKHGITIRYRPPSGSAGQRGTWGATGPLASHPRPTIRFNDVFNRHPTSSSYSPNNPDNRPIADGGTNGEVAGTQNWFSGGALRILHVNGVTIDGIAVDGITPQMFHNSGFWNAGIVVGNNAISIFQSANITISNCEIYNASKGINIYDRNPQGAFAVRNPHDVGELTPLGRFGRMGNHVIEYNRIHGNHQGIYMESLWDLSSTIRHNLIFNNNVSTDVVGLSDMRTRGAIAWRDTYMVPLAIYNNTFYNNPNNFIGMWQSGVQHLVFNNIVGFQSQNENNVTGRFPNRSFHNTFSARSSPGGQLSEIYFQWASYFVENFLRPTTWPDELQLSNPIEGADETEVSREELLAARQSCLEQMIGLPGVSLSGQAFRPEGFSVVQMEWAGMGNLIASGSQTITPPQLSNDFTFTVTSVDGEETYGPYACRAFIAGQEGTWNPTESEPQITVTGAILPGAIIPPATVAGDATKNMWLEIEGRNITSNGYYVAAGAENMSMAGFLQPNWTDPVIEATIRNGGWSTIYPTGTPQAQLPDIGAVQQSSPSRFVAHIRPTTAVDINPTTRMARGNYRLSVFDRETGEQKTMQNPEITHFRWIYPVPNLRNMTGGSDAQMIPAGAQYNVPLAQVTQIGGTGAHIPNVNGNSGFQFMVPTALIEDTLVGTTTSVSTLVPTIGFFEIAISGMVGGERVTSNVAFLPYRKMDYQIRVSFHPATTSSPSCPASAEALCGLDTVTVGENYLMRLEYFHLGNIASDVAINSGQFELQSDADAHLWCGSAAATRPCPSDAELENIPGMTPVEGAFPIGSMGRILSTYGNGVSHGSTFSVFFNRAGNETVLATALGRPPQVGITDIDVAFIGTRDIVVMPGVPAKLAFENPAPRRTLEISPGGCEKSLYSTPNTGNIASCAHAQDIAGMFDVTVIAQDIFGNAVNQEVNISISSDAPDVGDVRAQSASAGTFTNQTASTSADPDPNLRGRAHFIAEVTEGNQGQWFDMTATSGTLTSDVARLRVGNPSNRISVAQNDREIPNLDNSEVSLVAPNRLSATLTAGPNPADRSGGVMNFYVSGNAIISSGTLTIYDATGNLVKRLSINGNMPLDAGNKNVVTWNLTDRRGRVVSAGTYLVRGEITTVSGKRERVALLIGVR